MGEWVTRRETETCEIAGCEEPAAVRLDVPWEGRRDVCVAHARTWVQKEGVVGLPIAAAREAWSQGQGDDAER